MTSCLCIGGNPCPCQARQEQQRMAGLGPRFVDRSFVRVLPADTRREQSHQARLAAALDEPLAADTTWIEPTPAETHPGRLRGLWSALRGMTGFDTQAWRWW